MCGFVALRGLRASGTLGTPWFLEAVFLAYEDGRVGLPWLLEDTIAGTQCCLGPFCSYRNANSLNMISLPLKLTVRPSGFMLCPVSCVRQRLTLPKSQS